jgi:cysteine desulfurase family protein
VIYLDNTATSWPKPPEVVRAMADFMERAGGNPGRSGHRLSLEAGRIVYEAREALGDLFNAPDPLRIILTANGTAAINLALRGLLRPGDRVVCSGIEHNSVMRPLRALEGKGVDLTVVPCRPDGMLELPALERAVVPDTRLVVLNHSSNVTGTILPVAGAASIAHEAGALLLVDAAQTAGCLPIDVQAEGIDLLAFTGHKALLGPPGTGGLVIGGAVDDEELEPQVLGGTGSYSEHQEQPAELPDKYESGTPNGVGIAGLGAAVRFVMERCIKAIRAHEMELTEALNDGLRDIPGVAVYGPIEATERTAVVSFTVAGRQVSEIGLRLEEEVEVLCRVGLHCAPAAHRTIGTFPEGTVRLAPGVFTTREDVATVLRGVRKIVES